MPQARPAREADLSPLLALFGASEVSATAAPAEAERIWAATLADDSVAVFVSEAGSDVVATCMLITAPNLLRGGSGHAFLENVVTHPDWRGQGHGQAVVRAALAEAWARGCHHVLLQTGRSDPRVHRFYVQLGFAPGIRTGYAARRPG